MQQSTAAALGDGKRLGAWARLLWLEAGEEAEATAFEDTRDGGLGDAEFAGDVYLGAALAAQSLDCVGCGERDLARQ
jgi:hypothetical protein